jgi:hypothetical protein
VAKALHVCCRRRRNRKITDTCQRDTPTIGQEPQSNWLADVFGIDQRKLLKTSWNSLI